MVTTMRDKEIFLLAPGEHHPINPKVNEPQGQGAILVVEDDAPTLRLERVLLEEEGYSVEVVASGEEAVEAVTARKPALVLLDIGLPGMDGFTTCQRIRELSGVPIIMVTGRDCLDDKVKGMNVGADDYVTKPFLTHELATRVKVLLRRSASDNGAPHYLDGAAQGPNKGESPDPDNAAQAPTGAPENEGKPQDLGAEHKPQAAPETGQDAGPDAGDQVVIQQDPPAPLPQNGKDGVYEGNVRLTVTTVGPVSNLINFVSDLRQNPQFRLLRLVANQYKEGMDIWLGLREPLSLGSVLMGMKGVSEVTPSPEGASEDEEPLLKVLLH